MKNRLSCLLFALALFAATEARAQSCETATAANNELTDLVTDELQAILDFTDTMVDFINQDTDTAQNEIIARFDEFDINVRMAIGRWWRDGYLPALRDMTKQLSTMKPDQSLSMGAMEEAKAQVVTQLNMQEKTVEQDRRMRMSDVSCPAASVAPALGETERMARAMTNALSLAGAPRRMGQVGSVSQHGRAQERNAQWQVYQANFCDPADNNGASGCTVAGPMAGKDTDVNSLLWAEKQTIDMSTAGVGAQNQLLVNTALQNMLAPVAAEPILPTVVATATGQHELLRRRSMEARMKTAYNVMARMIGQRTGGKVQTQAAAVRAAGLNSTGAGADPSLVSSNPSYKEMMDAMTRDRHRQPDYLIKLVDDPAAITREQGNIKALQLQQMNEIYKRNEELLALMAAELAHDLDKETAGDALGANPVQ